MAESNMKTSWSTKFAIFLAVCHMGRGTGNDMPADIKKKVLLKHNKYRCDTVKVRGMKPLQWDCKLEALALRAASLCHFGEHELHTDYSYHVYSPIPGTKGWRKDKAKTGFDCVGENVFRQAKEDKAGLMERGATFVDAWMGEIPIDNYDNNVCNRGKPKVLYHKHTHVGCASKVCEQGTLTYCEYGPGACRAFEEFGVEDQSVSLPVCEFQNVTGSNFHCNRKQNNIENRGSSIEVSVIIPCVMMSAVYLVM